MEQKPLLERERILLEAMMQWISGKITYEELKRIRDENKISRKGFRHLMARLPGHLFEDDE